jgi:hypothetical protein
MIQGNSQINSAFEVNLNFRKRNTSAAVWLDFYKLAEQWQSDIKFVKEELRILDTLINRYFLPLLQTENNVSVKMLAHELQQAETQQRCLNQKISRHLRHLRDLVENPFSHDSHAFNDEHVTLEKELIEFGRDLRTVKHKTFEITERFVESEKMKQLFNV